MRTAAFGVLLWIALGALAPERQAGHAEKEQQSRSRLRDYGVPGNYGVCPRKSAPPLRRGNLPCQEVREGIISPRQYRGTERTAAESE